MWYTIISNTKYDGFYKQMKAHETWGLLILNSKDYVNLLILNLRNFQKFYTFLGVKKEGASNSKME